MHVALRIQGTEGLQAVQGCLTSVNLEQASRPCAYVRNELTYIILRGTRIVVLNILRRRVLELEHEGHQGVVKIRERPET